MVAQGHEARMHLGRDRAGQRAGGRVGRPQQPLRRQLRQIFGDRETVPDDPVTVMQHRDPAARRMAQDLALVPASSSGITTSSKSSPVAFSTSHGRSDQLE